MYWVKPIIAKTKASPIVLGEAKNDMTVGCRIGPGDTGHNITG